MWLHWLAPMFMTCWLLYCRFKMAAVVEEPMQDYLARSEMGEDGVWVTEVEVVAMATMLQTPIEVYALFHRAYRFHTHAPLFEVRAAAGRNGGRTGQLEGGRRVSLSLMGSHFEFCGRQKNGRWSVGAVMALRTGVHGKR